MKNDTMQVIFQYICSIFYRFVGSKTAVHDSHLRRSGDTLVRPDQLVGQCFSVGKKINLSLSPSLYMP